MCQCHVTFPQFNAGDQHLVRPSLRGPLKLVTPLLRKFSYNYKNPGFVTGQRIGQNQRIHGKTIAMDQRGRICKKKKGTLKVHRINLNICHVLDKVGLIDGRPWEMRQFLCQNKTLKNVVYSNNGSNNDHNSVLICY